ncbi:MAG: phosphatidylinositol dimannoside acyltransferase [Chloroflexota bacterium]|nr:phosphatidylinositol dimannoside acyltransferase [Chloroflexota bacterium]
MRSVSAAVFQAGNALAARVPARVRHGASRAGGDAVYYLAPGLRRQALENYAGILHQPAGSARVRRVARESLVGYAKLMTEFVLLPTLTAEQILAMVDWVGWDNIAHAVEAGRGAIVVTPHFGNWDLAAAAAVARGLPLTAVTEHFGDEAMNQRVVAARERLGMKVVPLGVSAGKAVLNALRRGEVVALVCDLPPKEGRAIPVRVCGQATRVPAGPALLALRTGAPVVPITCLRRPDNRYRLEVQAPIEFSPGSDQDADVARLSQAIMDRFEPILSAVPEQWYLYSPMWASPGAAAPAQSGRRPVEDDALVAGSR